MQDFVEQYNSLERICDNMLEQKVKGIDKILDNSDSKKTHMQSLVEQYRSSGGIYDINHSANQGQPNICAKKPTKQRASAK